MPRPRSDIQPRIVHAARARFLAEGVDGASLREIARDAGTNIGMVVYYFPTKDDLFLSVVEEVYARVVADMAQILGGDGAAHERLRRAFVRLGTASDLELEVMQLVAREALSSSSRLRRIVARFMRGHVPLLMATISDGIQNGEFDAAIPAPIVLLAVVGLGGLPQMARRASRRLPFLSSLPGPEGLADVSIGLIMRAVGARKTAGGAKERGVGRRPADARRRE
jgi:AcrR family transcriptional regulator